MASNAGRTLSQPGGRQSRSPGVPGRPHPLACGRTSSVSGLRLKSRLCPHMTSLLKGQNLIQYYLIIRRCNTLPMTSASSWGDDFRKMTKKIDFQGLRERGLSTLPPCGAPRSPAALARSLLSPWRLSRPQQQQVPSVLGSAGKPAQLGDTLTPRRSSLSFHFIHQRHQARDQFPVSRVY